MKNVTHPPQHGVAAGSGGGTTWLRGSGWSGPTVVSDNVFSQPQLRRQRPDDRLQRVEQHLLRRQRLARRTGLIVTTAAPAFADAANGDYRTSQRARRDVARGRPALRPGREHHRRPSSPRPPTRRRRTRRSARARRNPTTSTSASFAFTATQSGSTFECKLDAGAYAACTSPKAYSGLSIRLAHVQRARHRPGGQHRRDARTRTWTITPADTTPPDTTITSGPDPSTLSTSASFAFTASEAGSTFECKLDAEQLRGVHEPEGLQRPEPRARTRSRVRATDAAGNADATPATQTWTIAPDEDPGQPPPPADAPPTVALNAPANGAAVG